DHPGADGGDDAGVGEAGDHDEQSHEEHQGGPLDVAQGLVEVGAGDQEHEAGAEEGDDGGFDVHHGVQGEAGDDEGEHGQAADQEPAVGDGASFLQSGDLGDVVGVVTE